MREAEKALKASEWRAECECVRTEYPARDLVDSRSSAAAASPKAGRSSGSPARLGVDRKETMAIGDNWNDVDMLEWAGQGIVMANAAHELRAMAKTRGWKQAPSNDQDGVAVVLEAALARRSRRQRHEQGIDEQDESQRAKVTRFSSRLLAALALLRRCRRAPPSVSRCATALSSAATITPRSRAASASI